MEITVKGDTKQLEKILTDKRLEKTEDNISEQLIYDLDEINHLGVGIHTTARTSITERSSKWKKQEPKPSRSM